MSTQCENEEKIWPLVAGDTAFKFADHLALSGVSLDLEGATVTLTITNKEGEVVVSSPADVLQYGSDQDDTEPNIEWEPAADEALTDTGVYTVQWKVQLRGGRKITFPRGNPHKVRVYQLNEEWE